MRSVAEYCALRVSSSLRVMPALHPPPEAEKLLGKAFDFPVYTMVEFIDRELKAGRLRLRLELQLCIRY